MESLEFICKLKSYIQPFERKLAMQELSAVAGSAPRPVEQSSAQQLEYLVTTAQPSKELIDRLTFWEFIRPLSGENDPAYTPVARERLFGKPAIKRSAPKIRRTRAESATSGVAATTASAVPLSGTGFVMTLQQTDVGSGQKTPGANRRSPEIFIPLIARNANPEFWGWPDLFTADTKIDNKMNRNGVQFRIGTGIVPVNMMTWPAKADFRLRSEVLRSAGNIGDILRIEKNEQNDQYEYYAVVVPPGASDYDKYLALCNNKTRNSAKLWGYYAI